MQQFFADAALLPEGWRRNVRIAVAADGKIAAVEADVLPGDAAMLAGPIIPGIPDIHSHAFQRAMAGTAEQRDSGGDSFWNWRTAMYRTALAISPEQLEAVAAQLFVELLQHGYTSVAEFHYLHHDPDGEAYADPAELSRRVLAAAKTTGIRLTLLPVIYSYAGFGNEPLRTEQRRFRSEPDWVLRLLQTLEPEIAANPLLAAGIAPHSLRAVSTEALRMLPGAFPKGVIHIHIAEQMAEVEASLATSGRRPIELLADTVHLDRRWCLVHATHAEPAELKLVAKAGAVVALCPTTEANLGDGIFDFATYRDHAGLFGIGSDSNISADAAEELRWLEYAQRLKRQSRCVAGAGSTARALIDAAATGGAQALGQQVGRIAAGCHADWCVLDPSAAALPGTEGDPLLDQFLFAPRGRVIRDVFVGGRQVLENGRHRLETDIRHRFDRAISELQSAL